MTPRHAVPMQLRAVSARKSGIPSKACSYLIGGLDTTEVTRFQCPMPTTTTSAVCTYYRLQRIFL